MSICKEFHCCLSDNFWANKGKYIAGIIEIHLFWSTMIVRTYFIKVFNSTKEVFHFTSDSTTSVGNMKLTSKLLNSFAYKNYF